MNYSVLPPEINSAQMLSGAGSAPLLAAAAGWTDLSAELDAAAGSFASAISDLATAGWQGTAAQAMVAAAVPYNSWLSTAAAHAAGAAAQARAVADTFEAARAAIVQPAAVAANRSDLVSLVMSNLFGQNAPAIAATEGQYEQMWAQDVATMFAYHGGASAAAEQIPELENLMNIGFGNIGGGNWGFFNSGILNFGATNNGFVNFGIGNTGYSNVGIGNVGPNYGDPGTVGLGGSWGLLNNGFENIGAFNTGTVNLGVANTGSFNAGFFPLGVLSLAGVGNTGSYNEGLFNFGSHNIGAANTGSYLYGIGLTGEHQMGIGPLYVCRVTTGFREP